MKVPVIAIIGGGPCGLTLARLLQRKGIDYLVYERDENPTSNRHGGSLDLHLETGQLALQEAGLFEEFKKHARYEDTVFSIADKLGNKMLEVGQGRDAPEIDRSELRQLLLDSIPQDKIVWGHKLESARLGLDDKPVLRFGNGVLLSGSRLVVGADGAWSKIRPLLTPATPHYTGKSYIVSKIGLNNPHHATLATNVGVGSKLAISGGKYIMIQRQGNGSYRSSFGLQVPEDFLRNGIVNLQDAYATCQMLLSDHYVDWSDEYKDLIRYSADFQAWPLYTLSTTDMTWKSVPGITLAGDAAHLAYPGGEGVNLAMTDALQLAEKIVEHGIDAIALAVEQYEKNMFPRAIAAITESGVMAEVMCSEDSQAFIKLICS